MQTFNQGDDVICIENCGSGAKKTNIGIVLGNQIKYGGTCYCEHLDKWQLISSANNNMTPQKLTKAQKAGLSKDNQALIEAGIVGNDLELTSDGRTYVLEFLFETNREAIAKQAIKEIAEAKAEAKKANK